MGKVQYWQATVDVEGSYFNGETSPMHFHEHFPLGGRWYLIHYFVNLFLQGFEHSSHNQMPLLILSHFIWLLPCISPLCASVHEKAVVPLKLIVHQEKRSLLGYFVLFHNKGRYASEWQLNLLKVLNC